MPAGGWREEFKAKGAHTMAVWMQLQFDSPMYEENVTIKRCLNAVVCQQPHSNGCGTPAKIEAK